MYLSCFHFPLSRLSHSKVQALKKMLGTIAYREPRCAARLLFSKKLPHSGLGTVWSHVLPAPSPAHSCYLTHHWVTWSPLLPQELAGGRVRQGCAMLRVAFCLSAAVQHWSGRSSPSQICLVPTSSVAIPQAFRLSEIFLMQFINFLFTFPHLH